MLYQADILKKMNSIDDWDDYQECLDNFVSHFESATIKEEAKVVVGFMVYGNCVEFWEKIVTNEYEKTVQKIEKEKREAKNMSVEELKAHMYRKGDEAKENLMLTERLKKETEFYWNKYNMYKEKAKKQGLSNLLNIRD